MLIASVLQNIYFPSVITPFKSLNSLCTRPNPKIRTDKDKVIKNKIKKAKNK